MAFRRRGFRGKRNFRRGAVRRRGRGRSRGRRSRFGLLRIGHRM